MIVLFVGDVVGKPGRQAVSALVPRLKQEHGIDVVIANGENSAHGAGLTESTVRNLFAGGVDVITTGDHVYDKKEILPCLEREPYLLRPLNFPAGTPGRGSVVFRPDDKVGLGVVSLLGRVYLGRGECPFRAVEAEIARLRPLTNLIIVDFHAEATSEKIALGWFLDGKVSAVLGTHTHVTTADDRVLPQGTAYISDVGMCGPHDSVLGRDVDAVVRRFLTQMPQKLDVVDGDILLCGVLLNLDEESGRAR